MTRSGRQFLTAQSFMLVGTSNLTMSNQNPQRLATLIEPYLDDLFRAAFRLSGNKPDAEDLVQETCVRAFRNLKTLNQSGSPKGWLLRVQYNLFADARRRKFRSPFRSLTGFAESTKDVVCEEPGPDELAYGQQREDRFQQAWLRLSRNQRALLALRAEGYNLAELEEITCLKGDVLNSRLYRARRAFARQLRKHETSVVPQTQLERAK